MQKTVLITGASSGIGKATVHYFHQKNYSIIGVGRNKTELEKLKKELNHFHFLIADFQEPKQVGQCANEAVSFLKSKSIKLNTLINNAGIYQQTEPHESDYENWQVQFQVNLFASIQLTELLTPFIASAGSITNISSTLAMKPGAYNGAYSASKAAMNSWTQSLAQRLAPDIRVNAICPGIVDTPIHGLDHNPEKTKMLEQMNQLQPLKRVGQPLEIAKTIYFISSQESSWTTGALLNVDGGINLV